MAYHDDRADQSGRCGSKWDGSLAFPLVTGLSALVKVASYHADGYGHADAKLWLQLEWHGQRALASTD